MQYEITGDNKALSFFKINPDSGNINTRFQPKIDVAETDPYQV